MSGEGGGVVYQNNVLDIIDPVALLTKPDNSVNNIWKSGHIIRDSSGPLTLIWFILLVLLRQFYTHAGVC